ncbi:RidA family protein [Sulfitobacter sp. SK012]|uniref:RidA family protein n=1 Tax=Sulfitobacter sp. SK012 TaxID=1389005 RepID=UPI000E0AE3CA|nr:RidA family protein [Sulfitobacter sp. SK012]AXI48131.1 RidA family protein [Sulfitobacter sp. SK012]
MAPKRINPENLYNSLTYGFSHATVSEPGQLLHISGQVAWDSEYNVVGGNDLGAQARQAYANLKAVLESQGLTPADLVRIRTYVVDHSPDKLEPVAAEMMAFYGDATPAANTWIGVQALALPDFLIEIEATAQMR